MNTKIRKLLEEDQVDGVFAYSIEYGFPFPRLFTRQDAADLTPWTYTQARYPIVKMLLAQARNNPDKTYGALLRGCEERALVELFKWGQLRPKQVKVLGQACSQDLAAYCECLKPYPDQLDYGEPAEPVARSEKVEELKQMEREPRLNWWLGNFNRCIHCYGCRDVCPVCFCTECSLEHTTLLPAQQLPPDTSFHLVRAVHMAGRCIDCGLCEEVCPAKIPLRLLYKAVNGLVEEIFAYRPGSDRAKSPFNLLGEEQLLPKGLR